MKSYSKVLVALLLVMSLLLTAMPAFAAGTPSVSNIKLKSVTAASKVYTGKVLNPQLTVTDENGKTVSASGNYDVKVSGTHKNVGTYTVTVTGKGHYVGTVTCTFTIKKATNPFKITADKTSFKYSKTKDQTFYLHPKGVKEGATLVFSSSNSKVVIDRARRKVTIKKGFKGKATIKCTAKPTKKTKNYKATTRTITITVK